MTPKRNHLPKKLIGAGGIRLLKFPGLTYPAEVLCNHPKEPVTDTIPPWGICTAEAAKRLSCAVSTARTMMHKFEVRKQKVRRPKLPPTWYWDKYQVEAIAAARCKEIRGVPEQCMCSREVCAYLRISRSTLTRYVQCGLLSSMVYRKKSDCCACLSHFFHQSDVKCLRYHMNALKQKRALDLREDAEAES